MKLCDMAYDTKINMREEASLGLFKTILADSKQVFELLLRYQDDG